MHPLLRVIRTCTKPDACSGGSEWHGTGATRRQAETFILFQVPHRLARRNPDPCPGFPTTVSVMIQLKTPPSKRCICTVTRVQTYRMAFQSAGQGTV